MGGGGTSEIMHSSTPDVTASRNGSSGLSSRPLHTRRTCLNAGTALRMRISSMSRAACSIGWKLSCRSFSVWLANRTVNVVRPQASSCAGVIPASIPRPASAPNIAVMSAAATLQTESAAQRLPPVRSPSSTRLCAAGAGSTGASAADAANAVGP
eukprot:59272-Chlamydomonas_euryale.AAC.4